MKCLHSTLEASTPTPLYRPDTEAQAGVIVLGHMVELGQNPVKKESEVTLSYVQLLGTPWTVGYEAPPSMGFSRQEYWSGLPFPSPGDLPDPGIEPRSPALQADALPSEPPGKNHVSCYEPDRASS